MEENMLSDKEKNRIREIAELLVRRVSSDLKDDEKSFIGVPLQCRILAECFIQQVQTDIEDSRKAIRNQQLASDIVGNDQKFDLVSLYRKLMNTKRRIFRKEKVVTEAANHIAEDSIELTNKQVECHLNTPAIETIVSDLKQTEILWPPHLIYQPKSKRRAQVRKLDELCVRFGLVNRVNGNLEFLHRTYAEYLMAEYLFQGFHLEDDNGLLDNKSIRQLISDAILVEDQYNGVRIFLDSMLKEIVDTDNWRQIHDHEVTGTLPKRLGKLANDLPDESCNRVIENRNSNLFVLIFDCLQSTSNQTKIQKILKSVFNSQFPFEKYYEQSSRVFELLIKHYDVTKEDKIKFILMKMLRFSYALRPLEIRPN